MNRGRFIAVMAAILLAAISYRLYGIKEQPLLEYEANLIHGALDYTEKGLLPVVMWWHPPLNNILIYLSTGQLGYDTVGVRFWSLAFGILTIPLVALLSMELFGDRRAGCLSAFLLAVDPLHITFSRQAIQETHVAFFSLLGVYLTVRYIKRDSLTFLILAGLAFGFGLSAKLQAGFALTACCFLVIFPKMIKKERVSGYPLYLRLLGGVSILLLLPAAVYFFTYLPWLLRGYDVSEWFYLQKVSLYVQRHTTIEFDIISNSSRAVDWFVRLSGYASIVNTDRPHLTFGINNLLVWWLVIPSFIYLGYRYLTDRIGSFLYVSILFWLSYLPFVIISRPVWLLSATSVIPFAFLGIGQAAIDIKDRYGVKNGWPIGYLGLVLLVSLLLYPLTCGRGFDYQYLAPIIERFKPY